MKPKKIDLAAGRLGKAASPQAPAGAAHAKTNYGFDRLGIRADQGEPAPEPQEPVRAQEPVHSQQPVHLMQPHDLPQAPVGGSEEHLQLQQALRDSATKAQQRPVPMSAPRPAQVRTHAAPPPRPAIPRKFLYAGAAGLLSLIVIICIARSGTKSPASASAHALPPSAASAYEPTVAEAPALPSEPARREATRARVAPVEMSVASINIPSSQQTSGELVEQALQTPEPPAARQGPARPTAAAPPAPAAAPAVPAAPTFREPPPGISLSGVINCSDGAYASINNRMVKAGSVVSGAKVIQVRDFSVEMEMDGQRFILGIGTGSSASDEEPAQDESDRPAEKPKAKSAESKPADQAETPAPAKSKRKRSAPKSG